MPNTVQKNSTNPLTFYSGSFLVPTLDPDGPGGGQSAVTLASDHNGNLTENPSAFNAGDSGTPTGQKYEYDEENRLVRVKRLTSPPDQVLLEIGYDAFGRRVESKEYLDGTGQPLSPPRVTHHVVLGPMTIEEYTITAGPTATLVREFVWGTEFPMPTAMIDRTGSQAVVLHYLRDVLGNVVALSDANGDVVERYRYDPYGMTHIYTGGGALLPASAYGNPYAYTGQRYDTAVALYHFWLRTYSPSLGRWHQRDPFGYVDGASLYEYCRAEPLGGIDRFGAMLMPLSGGVASTGAPAVPFTIEIGGAAGAGVFLGEGALVAGSAYVGWWGGNWLVENTSVENHVGHAIYLNNSLDPMGMTPTAMYWAGSHCVLIGQTVVCTTAANAANTWMIVEQTVILAPSIMADVTIEVIAKFFRPHRTHKSRMHKEKHTSAQGRNKEKKDKREGGYRRTDTPKKYKNKGKRCRKHK